MERKNKHSIMGRWSEDFNFVTTAFSGDHLVVALTPREIPEDSEVGDLTLVVVRRGPNDWIMLEQPYLWCVVDSISSYAQETAVFLGMEGQLLFLDRTNATNELVEPNVEEGPDSLGPLRGLGVINGILYMVGMGRQVYRRSRRGRWEKLNKSIRLHEDDENIVGFNAIGGFSDQEFYVCGFEGEIWRGEKSRFFQIDSPTNMPLTHIFCDEDGSIYICGRCGTLLTGRWETWEILAKDVTDDDFWSIVRYRDRLYILGTLRLYSLEDGILKVEPIAGESCGFGHQLIVRNERLWLVGPQDLLAYDGEQWKRIN